jgi:hypothetical protein
MATAATTVSSYPAEAFARPVGLVGRRAGVPDPDLVRELLRRRTTPSTSPPRRVTASAGSPTSPTSATSAASPAWLDVLTLAGAGAAPVRA